MSFYKEVPGRKTTLESTLKFDTTPTAGSTNPVTSDGVANTVSDILDDHATTVIDEEITVPTAEAAGYTVGNYFEQDGEIWKCTAKTDNGDGTWTIEAEKVNGIVPALNSSNIKNVQADWNQTDPTANDFIKNKPFYQLSSFIDDTFVKVCTFALAGEISSLNGESIDVLFRQGNFACIGSLTYKTNAFVLLLKNIGNVNAQRKVVFYHVIGTSNVTIYAKVSGYTQLSVAPKLNLPKARVDFTDFGTVVSSLPEGATEITPVWVASSAVSSGGAPVKVDAYGDLTPVTMDDVPTEGSTNLMTSGAIKTALDQLSARIAALE